MFKKSAVLLPYGNLQNLHPPSLVSSTSPPHFHFHRPAPITSRQQLRSYAIVFNGHSSNNHEIHRWPQATTANAIPTPYQIFNLKKGSPYSKHRFYELVKLYHPDRHGAYDGLSYATKLERYRLIVCANDILSDPIKRGAYDCYGAGWNGMPDVSRNPEDGCGKGEKVWGNPNGPSQNATWEDWERWYAREADGPQEPRSVSNGAFVGLIVIFAALGGIGQATRVGNFSAGFVEQRDALHKNISKDLMRRRRETASSLGNREERIHHFLKQRDGGVDPRDEAYHKLLPNPEVYSSEGLQGRRAGIFEPSDSSKGGG